LERAAEFKSEYYNGHMFMMAGGSDRHLIIIGNMQVALAVALEERQCVVTSSDGWLRVSPSGLYTYPDVMVSCGERKFADDQKDTLLNPVVVVEVLSPSTEAYDRGFKAGEYRALESLKEYALVSQNRARVEIFRRHSDGEWRFAESVGLDATCRFDSLDCHIALARIYRNVTFDSEDAAPPRLS
jgi:Uma2 family endonuclease